MANLIDSGDASIKDEKQELLDVHPKKERLLSVKPKNFKKDRKKTQISLNDILDDDFYDSEDSESDEELLILSDSELKKLPKFKSIDELIQSWHDKREMGFGSEDAIFAPSKDKVKESLDK